MKRCIRLEYINQKVMQRKTRRMLISAKNRGKIRSVEYIVVRDIFECEFEFYDELFNEHKDILNVKE